MITDGGLKTSWHNRLGGKAAIDITPIEGLKISGVIAPTYNFNKVKSFVKQVPYTYANDPTTVKGYMAGYRTTKLTENRNDDYDVTTQFFANYNKSFGCHDLSAMIGYEDYYAFWENLSASRDQYELTNFPYLDLGPENLRDNGGNAEEYAYRSFFVRISYSYANRYLLLVNFRRDGSSRLATDTRWGNFWAVSALWRLSQENFMKPWENVVSDMKLRASYGVNGNLPTGYYGYHGTYTTGAFYNGKPAPWEDAIANPDLTWEKNYALNLGVDLSLFRRVNLTFDWYTRTTKDLLMSKQLNSISGFGSILTNVGEMKNTGFEIEVRSSNIQTKDFSWTTSLNLSHNKNKIVKLADLPEFIDGNYIRKEGCSYATIYLREYAGVDPNDGRPMYYDNKEDENGNRSRNIVYDPNDADRVELKDIYPKLTGGLMNTFNYKFIDLSFNLSFHLGGYSYDGAMYALQDDGYTAQYNKSTELRRRWKQPGDITDVPRYVYGQEYGGWWNSSRGVHSTDHLRLKSLIVGVAAPQSWLRTIGINSARIYFSGTNLLTWAAYDQYDPELNGIVSYFTPPLKTFAFGLELKF